MINPLVMSCSRRVDMIYLKDSVNMIGRGVTGCNTDSCSGKLSMNNVARLLLVAIPAIVSSLVR